MRSEIAIEVHDLSKRYDVFTSPAKRMRSLLLGRHDSQKYFEALKPLSFEIERGSFLGIIGQNGSGKSTLLQLITGILPPSSGSVSVRGRVAALLELGAGFNPEFTGRENARLNAQILGIPGREFEKLMPEIEAFAEIGEFIDRPVKVYSSGMYVRLAFAIQACIDPEVLIVDEALAVGDIFFRLKCYERLERLRARGCTVILVTHSMEDVMHYCDKVLLLHHGEAVYFGPATDAVNRYYALGRQTPGKKSGVLLSRKATADEATAYLTPGGTPPQPDSGPEIDAPEGVMQTLVSAEQSGDGLVRCSRVGLTDATGQVRQVFSQGERMHVHAEFEILADLPVPVAGFVIRTDRGVIVHGRNSGQCGSSVPALIRKGDTVSVRFDIPLDLGRGEYVLDVGFATWPEEMVRHAHQTTMAELEAAASRHCMVTAVVNFSVVPAGSLGFAAQPFYGLVSLESDVHVRIAPHARHDLSPDILSQGESL